MLLYSFLLQETFSKLHESAFIEQFYDHYNYSASAMFEELYLTDNRYVIDVNNAPIIIYQGDFKKLTEQIFDTVLDLKQFAESTHSLILALEPRYFEETTKFSDYQYLT